MKIKAPRNQTLSCSAAETELFAAQLLAPDGDYTVATLEGRIINGDAFAVLPRLPAAFVDLLVLDPPYNLSKNYHGQVFKAQEADAYGQWFERVIALLLPTLKPQASVYVCADWKTSMLIAPILAQYLTIRNRITWEREKGRGAKNNWKNNTEDIWFCTVADDYYFDVEAVKLKRKVLAPYKVDGKPKDWVTDVTGNFRLTHPSNVWSDITIPFWSMPENTDHPTQKPEKLLAKLILASSRPNDMVFDPFLGSGSTAVVAQKLGRRFVGIEQNRDYGCWALKRLHIAALDPAIQGYADGVFWERNSRSSSS